ncbi:MAG TPA: ribbon-helix-helix domain-containing protein [Humisphaera sp.]|nr:ribbon-helix-helix domain-containing protein [Humisphaera sp.]
MRSAKIAVTIDRPLLARLDRIVKEGLFPNGSRAFQEALLDKLERMKHRRLARECAKLDPRVEQYLADEGLAFDRKVIIPDRLNTQSLRPG